VRLCAAFPLVFAHLRPLMQRYDACNRVTGEWVTHNDAMAASAPAICGTRYRPGRKRCAHGEKPHRCDTCGKAFSKSGILGAQRQDWSAWVLRMGPVSQLGEALQSMLSWKSSIGR
jgi:hypothetical protein